MAINTPTSIMKAGNIDTNTTRATSTPTTMTTNTATPTTGRRVTTSLAGSHWPRSAWQEVWCRQRRQSCCCSVR